MGPPCICRGDSFKGCIMNYSEKSHVEKMSGYLWWKKRKRTALARRALIIILMDFAIFWAVCLADLSSFKRSDLLFGCCTLLFFLGYGLYQLVLLFKSFAWRIDQYWYGTITDMYQTRHPNRRIKDSVITASISGKSMDGICLSQTYHRANIGDQVLLFTLGDDTVMVVHPHM